MKTLGLLGGLTWHSTAVYYDQINRGVASKLGPFRSASLVLHSIDYGRVRDARTSGDWRGLGRHLVGACRGLKRAGADGLVLCSNTIHRFETQIASETGLAVLHVADAVVARAKADGIESVGLLGTAYTVEQRFYRERLEAGGLEVLVADKPSVRLMDHILLEQVASGTLLDESRAVFVAAIEALVDRGGQAMVLGCTEIGLLVGPSDTDVPLLETVAIHADYAVAWALSHPGQG
jgi:aspartate racemase